MANKISENPVLPVPNGATVSYLTALYRNLLDVLRSYARRINAAYVADGTETATGPMNTASYTVATLPPVGTGGGIIYVSNEAGGATIAFSDGTNWRRVSDRAIVS